MSPSEQLAVRCYESATGEKVSVVTDDGNLEFAKGIDPVTLSAILDIVLSFIFGLIDKLREGGLCVRDPVSGQVVGSSELPDGTVGLPMSVEDRADAVIATAKNPKWRQRARLHRDIQSELKGAVDSWDMTNGMLRTVGDTANKPLVVGSIEEGEEPDFGWV